MMKKKMMLALEVRDRDEIMLQGDCWARSTCGVWPLAIGNSATCLAVSQSMLTWAG